jgi:hypothetical protein
MGVKPRIMVSHPASGFGVYLPHEVVDVLGGIGAAFTMGLRRVRDGGSTVVTLHSSRKGPLVVRRMNRSTFPARIFWNSKVKPPTLLHFRPLYLDWKETEDGIEFTLPKREALQTPHTNNKVQPRVPLLIKQQEEELLRPFFNTDMEPEGILMDLLAQGTGLAMFLEMIFNDDEVREVLLRRLKHLKYKEVQ